MPEYAPFPLVDDPAVFGLETTTLGEAVVRHRRQRSTRATVFLHGAAGSWTTWTPVLQAGDVSDPVLLDLPGWGGAGATPPAGVDAACDVVVRALDALGYTEWDVVGHSLGGFLALHLAATHADRVRSVALVSGTTWSVIESVSHPVSGLFALPGFTGLWRVMQALAALGPVGRGIVSGLSRARLLRAAVFPLFRHPFRVPGSVVDALAREVRPVAFSAAAALARRYPADELWASIGCPVTALKGDRDVFVRGSDLEHLRAVVPHARTLVVADCGHFATVEHPEAVLAAIR